MRAHIATGGCVVAENQTWVQQRKQEKRDRTEYEHGQEPLDRFCTHTVSILAVSGAQVVAIKSNPVALKATCAYTEAPILPVVSVK